MLKIFLLTKRLSITVLLFSICRALFYAFNNDYFFDGSFLNLLTAFLHGIRFDISATIYCHLLFIILQLSPVSKNIFIYQSISKWLFVGVTSILLLSDCVDFEYFKFTSKRTTADIFQLMGLGNDFFILIPQVIKDYWYAVVIWLALSYIALLLYRKTETANTAIDKIITMRPAFRIILTILTLAALIVGARGGLQYKPITIINAALYSPPGYVPLVLNTPFSIITTLGKQELETLSFFKDSELEKIYTPYQKFDSVALNGNRYHKKDNIVIIVMESFSNKFIGKLNGGQKSYTPFLDSLITQSLVFDNFFANGRKSIEAIPAVFAGLPALMDNPFITSVYAGNTINGIAGMLRSYGYNTAFFHGGNNGTMGFQEFAFAAGFEKYYGRNEFANDQHYDGNWGIWDEEFFQYFAEKTGSVSVPFLGCFMSLSSHHPYTIPKKHQNRFPTDESKIQTSIRYADYALRKFFETVSQKSWFNNTLFIITADHTAETRDDKYRKGVGMYSIPLILYKPGSQSLHGTEHRICQQTDILPSVIHYVGYDKPFVSFGNSIFDNKNSFAVSYLNGLYQLINKDYVIQHDGTKTIAYYDFKNDFQLENNLLETESKSWQPLEKKLKAIIQSYNSRMNNNALVVKSAKLE